VNLNNNNKNSINIIKNRAHSVIGADTDSGTASAKLITTGKPQRIKTRVAVIGAGIAGCAIARELSKYKLDVAVLEKEADISWGTTKANSGHIHPGYAGHEGTLRLSTCRTGQLLFLKKAQELSIPVKWIGSMLNILLPEQMKDLEHLLQQGRKYNVPGLEIITDKERLKKLEPNLSNKIIAAFYCREHYICSPYEAALATAENAAANGVKFIFDAKVTGIYHENSSKTFYITATDFFGKEKEIEAQYIVNAAGVFADDVAKMAGDDSFAITAIKGQYFLLDSEVKNLTNHLNIRVADADNAGSKGMYVGRTFHDNAILGSNYEVTDKFDVTTSVESLNLIRQKLADMIDNIPYDKVVAIFSGLRAYADSGDFVLGPSIANKNFINAAGIQSPGLTCAFLIAEMTADYLKESGLKMKPNPKFVPVREKPLKLDITDYVANNVLFGKDKCFGEIECRCEKITEAEIVQAIKNGAATLDGVKFRTRAGMGRCQGGYCTTRVMRILSRETGIPFEKITKSGGNSYIAGYKMQ
jgi:glycerol-3-phosphate dehydrogenase